MAQSFANPFRSGLEHLSWYAYKGETRRYLEELNKDKKVSVRRAWAADIGDLILTPRH